MLVGHVAVGLGAKRIAPKTSLGTLVLAALLADLLWFIFLIVGIERVEFKAGRGAANYFLALDIAYSHSLIAVAMCAGLLAASNFAWRRRSRCAWALFGAGLSHWGLDWLSHRPDLPLAPGLHRYFGLGLWNSAGATVVVEGGFWLCAIALYLRSTDSRRQAASYIFWSGVVVLTLAWWNNVSGPPPANPGAGIRSLFFFTLIVAWAYSMNRLRPARCMDRREPD